MKIIIINGFLGSGKTTFLQKCLMFFKNKKIGLIINEFGDFSIDHKLIEDISTTKREIHSGSIFCSCKEEEFIIKMNELISNNMELIIVESSGFSNPTSLDRIINYIILKNNINPEVMRVTICDAKTLYKIINTLSIIENQIEYSDLILLNKIDLVNEDELSNAISIIKKVNNNSKIICCSYCNIDYNNIFSNEFYPNHVDSYQTKDISLKSVNIYFKKSQCLDNIISLFNNLKNYVFRIKGFVKIQNDKNYYFELSSDIISYKEYKSNDENRIIILYSSKKVGLEKIKNIINKYLNDDYFM